MKILAVDTSSEICNVAIFDEKLVAAEYFSKSIVTHTERLLPAIQELMTELGWKFTDLNGLAVINGPGSFTGLRIGLSVIKGFAYGLGLRIVPGNALETAASQVSQEGLICPMMDARRGEVFTALYKRTGNQIIQVHDPISIKPEEFKTILPEEHIRFCGPGAYIYREHFAGERAEFIFSDFVLARTLGYYALQKFREGESISALELRAAYLRPSDAETKGARPRKHLGSVPRR